jgi:hypothetical protein
MSANQDRRETAAQALAAAAGLPFDIIMPWEQDLYRKRVDLVADILEAQPHQQEADR